jgi:trimeric autotransporter adhesin
MKKRNLSFKARVCKVALYGTAILVGSIACMNTAHAQNIATFAGNGTSTSAGDGGAATAASFYYPSSVTRDATGNTYVIEGSYIRKIDASGTISTIAGDGTFGFSGDGGPATAAAFRIGDDFSDIILDNAGNIYFTDVYNHRVRKINTAGIITTIAGTGTSGYNGDGIAATTADLNRPRGLALDAAGNMYIADNINSAIRKIDMATGIISTVAGQPTFDGYGGDGSAATSASVYLKTPTSVAVDAAGNLFIAEYFNNTVRRVDATSGIITTIAGSGTIAGASGDGGLAVFSLLDHPTSVSVDPAGNVFIADFGNDAIRRINTSGTIATVIGTNGTSGYSGDGGAATAATLDGSSDIYLAANGDVYVSDAGNYRIRLATAASIALSGTATSCIAGTNTLAAAAAGGVWTSGNPAIATVSAAGVVTAVSAGTATISYGMGLGFGSTVYTVNPAPAPVVSAAGPSLSVAGSFASYQWLLAGSPVAGATSATYMATTDGSYAVTVTDANGCSGTSATQIVSGVGLNDINSAGALAIYPNPAANGSFTVDVPTYNNESMTIVVMSITGEKVYEATATSRQTKVKLNVPAGMYMVHLVAPATTHVAKIMVK